VVKRSLWRDLWPGQAMVSTYFVRFDPFKIKTYKVFIGSIIAYLVHMVMLGSPADNLATLWAAIKVEYGVLGIEKSRRYGDLKMTMFSKAIRVSLLEFEGVGRVGQEPVQNLKLLIRSTYK
jgi:hypothetical protein